MSEREQRLEGVLRNALTMIESGGFQGDNADRWTTNVIIALAHLDAGAAGVVDQPLRERVGYWLKCQIYSQPLMGVDWSRRENQRYLDSADEMIAMILAAARAQGPGPGGETTTICGQCWYIAWAPVETQAECTKNHPHADNHERCDYCWLKDQHTKLLASPQGGGAVGEAPSPSEVRLRAVLEDVLEIAEAAEGYSRVERRDYEQRIKVARALLADAATRG